MNHLHIGDKIIRKIMYLLRRQSKFHNMKYFFRNGREYLFGLVKNLPRDFSCKNSLFDIPERKIYLQPNNKSVNVEEITVRLATFSKPLTSISFNNSYGDQEDIYAERRFIWLFEVIFRYPTKEVFEVGLRLILKWISYNENNKYNQ